MWCFGYETIFFAEYKRVYINSVFRKVEILSHSSDYEERYLL